PCRPAPLRGTADHEFIYRDSAAIRARAKRRDGVHRPHDTLRHWQAKRPGFVAGSEELLPSVDGDGVFTPPPTVACENKRLVADHWYFANHRVGSQRQLSQHWIDLGRRLLVRTAADDQQACARCQMLRPYNAQPMLPDRSIYLLCCAPLLRGHFQHVGS